MDRATSLSLVAIGIAVASIAVSVAIIALNLRREGASRAAEDDVERTAMQLFVDDDGRYQPAGTRYSWSQLSDDSRAWYRQRARANLAAGR